MPERIVSVLRSVLAAVAVLGLVGTLLFAQLGPGSLPLVVGSAVVGTLALAAAAGPGAVLWLFGLDRNGENGDAEGATTDEVGPDGRSHDDPDWWLARVEPAVEDAWDHHADYALAAGLAILGVGALAGLAVIPDPPMQLAVVALLCLNGALIALAGSALEE